MLLLHQALQKNQWFPLAVLDIISEYQQKFTIYSNDFAFAAKLVNGCVVTWGDDNSGGNSSFVQARLKRVVTIYSTSRAFAATKILGLTAVL